MKKPTVLLSDELRAALPALYSQERIEDPVAYAHYFFEDDEEAGEVGWHWFPYEGQQDGDDYKFFGFVIGYEEELGYFTLHELESTTQPKRTPPVVPMAQERGVPVYRFGLEQVTNKPILRDENWIPMQLSEVKKLWRMR